MRVTVEIPDAFAAVLAPEGDEVARKLLEEHVAQAYREGRLTGYELQLALGMKSRFEVDPFLAKHQIFDYTVEDFRRDTDTVRGVRLQRQ